MSLFPALVVALVATTAFSQEVASTPAADSTSSPIQKATPAPMVVASSNKSNAISVHPVTGLLTAAIAGIPTYVYLTYERELGGGRSFVLQPLVMFGEFSAELLGGDESEPGIKATQVGAIASYRFYRSSEESKGLYLAPALGFYYITVEQDANWYTRGGSASGAQIIGMGYVGYRFKNDGISFHTDLGYGLQRVTVSNSDVETSSASGQAFDLNIGLGICF